jgi:large subunit ribosomal protein L11
MEKTIDLLIEGGKATPAPPLGPALSPLKVNIAEVVAKINEETKNLAGMQVPVKVIIDTNTKKFKIRVGTPSVAAMIKKELRLEKGGQEPGKLRVGDLTDDQVRKIAKMKFGSDAPHFYSQVKGTGVSMGVSVGKGAVTEEEVKKYQQEKKAKEDAAAAAAAEKAAAVVVPGAAPAAGAVPAAPGAAPAAGAVPAAAPAKKEEKAKK